MDKKIKKLTDKKCHFCDEDDYNCLDVHRIIPGSAGGKYNNYNSLTCCVTHHRKIHSGEIKILEKRLCSNGTFVIIYTENGIEKIR